MKQNELCHYGVLGMRWGIRRTEAQLARARGKKKDDSSSESTQKNKSSSTKSTTSKKKTVSEMTEDELRKEINRLELEQRYRNLMRSVNPPKSRRGRDLVLRILERSAENVGTQVVTSLMGKAANKTIGKMFKDANIANLKTEKEDKKDKKDK